VLRVGGGRFQLDLRCSPSKSRSDHHILDVRRRSDLRRGAALRQQYRRQLIDLFRANAAALLTVNGSNELINLGGGLGNRYALLFAPLSFVQAISSTTTLFVFVFGVLLSVLVPQFGRETLSWRDLLQKGTAAVLVALGVALVTR
jgi:drug/metabolite transporter (DMT)-like permease